MNHAEAAAIEVEVIEIDGSAPEAATPIEPPPSPWEKWQGSVRHLDRRWWPVWVVLGVIAALLLCTLGVAVALFLVVFIIIRHFVRTLGSMFRI